MPSSPSPPLPPRLPPRSQSPPSKAIAPSDLSSPDSAMSRSHSSLSPPRLPPRPQPRKAVTTTDPTSSDSDMPRSPSPPSSPRLPLRPQIPSRKDMITTNPRITSLEPTPDFDDTLMFVSCLYSMFPRVYLSLAVLFWSPPTLMDMRLISPTLPHLSFLLPYQPPHNHGRSTLNPRVSRG